MRRAIDVKADEILHCIANLDNIGSLEIDEFGRKSLNCRLWALKNVPDDITKTRFEIRHKIFGLFYGLRFGFFLPDDLPSFLAAVDVDLLVPDVGAEFRTLHVRHLDVVLVMIRSGELALREREKPARSVNFLYVEKHRTAKRLDHCIEHGIGAVGTRLHGGIRGAGGKGENKKYCDKGFHCCVDPL